MEIKTVGHSLTDMVDGNKIIIIFYFIYCVCANYKCCIMPSRGPGIDFTKSRKSKITLMISLRARIMGVAWIGILPRQGVWGISKYPSCWKIANVLSLFKKGDKSIASNYRSDFRLTIYDHFSETVAWS
jgi:hypothetical protein